MSAQKCKIIGIICLIVSVVLLAVFGVSALVNRASGPERFLAKYEKLCLEGDRVKLAKMYDKDLGMQPEDVVIPYEEYDKEFIYEGIVNDGNQNYTLLYVVNYDMVQDKTVDGVAVQEKVKFSYSGNEMHIRKTVFGYKMTE